MGKPKQLLAYNGKTLLNIVISESIKTKFNPIVVVLGAYAKEIAQSSDYPEVIYAVNNDWENGMSSSISFGLKTALNINSEIENAIFTVADQVHISTEIIEKLHYVHHTEEKNIVTSAYAETTGTPTLFNKKYFGELLNLTGESGAKVLIKEHSEDTATISFDLGKVDIDTETDYKNLIIP
ncbi:MAG: nucleotidyltransferase family protein [Pedobacter sp.]|nr:MAG: nucleotidyltransferase family protein [Pedobacter sp.]